jgi:hypothetical protein
VALLVRFCICELRGRDEWQGKAQAPDIRGGDVGCVVGLVKRLQRVDICTELEQILGNEARFRRLQEPVLDAIIKHKSLILAVMGTGVRSR